VLREGTGLLRTETSKIVRQAQLVVGGVMRFVFTTFLVLMLTAFITVDNERIKTFIMGMTPIEDRSRFEDLLERIDHGLSGVVRGQLTICVINGVLTLAGLLLLKVKFALLLGCLAAVFSLVPIFGSILSTIPIVLVALSTGISTALFALAWIVVIHALEANLLNPKIMGDAAKIHPVVVVLALIVGEHFFGIVGALLAVPLLSIAVTLYKTARSRAISLDEEIHVEEATDPRMQRAPGPRRPAPPRRYRDEPLA
jgi:predicted PurR-regulated permease PerM